MAQLTSKVVRFHEFGPAEVLKVENIDIRFKPKVDRTMEAAPDRQDRDHGLRLQF